MSKTHRIGIAGFDHWYIARGVVDAVASNGRAEVVAVAHRDEATIRQYAKEKGIANVTTSYMDVATRDDIDVLVSACPTSENVELCLVAAGKGKHILSVKPAAMTVDEADRLVKGVKEAGVVFYPFESYGRAGAQHPFVKGWINEGKIGTPISATIIQRASLGGASQDWPGRKNENTWWRTPSMVFGGGWLDHAIYQIDMLRFLLDDEVARISGVTKTLAHPELQKPLEDFGVALVEFKKGLVATIEVTWHAPPSGGLSQTQIVGTEGQIVYDPTVTGRVSVSGKFDGPTGGAWSSFAPPWRGGGQPLDHVLDCIEGKTTPLATVEDARANVAACLAFYEAARTGRAVTLAS
jgi:predicted dehydrogenase